MNDRPHNGSPKLPKMTPVERELWGNAKGLPQGYVIMHQDELAQIAGAARAAGGIVDTIFAMLQPVKLDKESPMDTIARLMRDLGRLSISAQVYGRKLTAEEKAEADAEIFFKLQPKKKAP